MKLWNILFNLLYSQVVSHLLAFVCAGSSICTWAVTHMTVVFGASLACSFGQPSHYSLILNLSLLVSVFWR